MDKVAWPTAERFSGPFCRRMRLRYCIKIERLAQKASVGHRSLSLFETRRAHVVSAQWRASVYAGLRILVVQDIRRTLFEIEKLGDPIVALAHALEVDRRPQLAEDDLSFLADAAE